MMRNGPEAENGGPSAESRGQAARNNRPAENRMLRIGYYGDDFTGSTDAMEALAQNGVKTVLFLRLPSAEDLRRFPDIRGLGIAGVSRSLSPREMEPELLPAFRALRQSGVRIAHYKTCSTFDSSPDIGSIGKAIEIARSVYREQSYVPLMAGVPPLRRYTVFGHHFAAAGQQVYRLDRHPVMSRHPVTPMKEADLLLHLSEQTSLASGLVNVVDLSGPPEQVRRRLDELMREGCDIVLFDVMDDVHLCGIGRLLAEESGKTPLFAAGSSGIEYALCAYWRSRGTLEPGGAYAGAPGRHDRLVVLSGSCSPITGEQIAHAESRGFAGFRIPVEEWIDPDKRNRVRDDMFAWAGKNLSEGKSLVLYTATGPDDESIARLQKRFSGPDERGKTGERIGVELGRWLKELIGQTGVRRIVVAGGDTSGYVTRELDIYALETLAPADPGGPLCRGYSGDPRFDGIELALKGGQVGKKDYFAKIRDIR